MKQYKGYYIDNIYFNNKQDIDNHIEKMAVEAYKTACRLFDRDRSMEASMYADDKAEFLVKHFGYTWEQIEAIEIETFKAA